MEVLVPFETKQLRETVQGELICLPAPGERSDYGFVIDLLPEAKRRVAILQSGPRPAQLPYWTIASGHWDCLSYGTEWVLELIPPKSEDTSVAAANRYAGGMIAVRRDNVSMQLVADPENKMSTDVTIDLRTLVAKHELIDGSVFINRWQIWRAAADIHDPNIEPLLRFGV